MSEVNSIGERIRLYISQLLWAGKYTKRYAEDHCMWFGRLRETLKPYIQDFNGLRILDIGCGMLYWQTMMLHSLGAKVTGIDHEYIRSDRKADKYLHLLKTQGLERMLKTFYWDYSYRGKYEKALQECTPFPLIKNNLDLYEHKAETLPFADNSFDLVVSHEVLEHIADIPQAISEIKRVLKPGGFTYHTIHLFSSISGGHHMEWKFPDEKPSTKVPAWDHLRKKQFPEHPSWLNELPESAFKEAFYNIFDVLLWEPSVYEGKTQLTPEIRQELAQYTEEALLKKGVIVVATKT